MSLMVKKPWETSILDGFIIKVTPEDEFLFLGCDGIFELNSNQAVVFFFFFGEMRDTWYGSLLMFGVLLVDGHGFAIDSKRMKVLTSVKAPYFPHPESIMKTFL